MMKINWSIYDSPFQNQMHKIENLLDELLESTDSDYDMDFFIYNKLAPMAKHQGEVYNVIEAILDYLQYYLDSKTTNNIHYVLVFLEYIFEECIREDIRLLVTPVRYNYSPDGYFSNVNLRNWYAMYKKFYLKHINGKMSSDKLRSEFLGNTLFLSFNQAKNYFYDILESSKTSPIECLDAIISLQLLAIKHSTKINLEWVQQSNILGHEELAKALCGIDFSVEKVCELIKTPNNSESIWGTGYKSLIAAFSLLVSCRFSTIKRQKEIIKLILECYQSLKEESENEHEFEFPEHFFLLEDLTSFFFREMMGNWKSKILHFNEPQRFCLDLLMKKYKVHTYSLLFAGILPEGVNETEINNIQDIYNCY